MKKKILCIEDETDLRDNIALILQSEGYEVFQAANGQEGLDQFHKAHPDLILCDINMPVMNGYEVLNKINAASSEKKQVTPFIFLTALGQKKDVISGMERGADEYIAKPVDFDLLLSSIKARLKKADVSQDYQNHKLDEVYDKVSNLIPNEIKDPLASIISLSGAMKNEILGAFVDPRYVEMSSKIYLLAMQLNSKIEQALNSEMLSQAANDSDNKIAPEALLSKIKQKANNNNITYTLDKGLPNIMIDSEKFSNITSELLKKLARLPINGTLAVRNFLDYLDNMVITATCACDTPQNAELEEFATKFMDASATLNTKYNEDTKEQTCIITIPKHRLKHA
jgi:DNA-binding response OmpR family regulator